MERSLLTEPAIRAMGRMLATGFNHFFADEFRRTLGKRSPGKAERVREEGSDRKMTKNVITFTFEEDDQ